MDPEEAVAAEAPEVDAVATEAEAPEIDETEQDEQPDEGQAEPDLEEIEYEGAKHSVPKALKDAFMRTQDYTRKTQEVADTRKALEARQAEISQQAEIRAATHEERVTLAVLDKQLEQIGGIDWTDYAKTYGAEAAIAAQGQWQQLKDQRATLAQNVTAKENELRSADEQATANAIREAHEVLTREVQGYGQELVGHVAELAGKYGITGQEVRESFVGADGKADTRLFRLLTDLHKATGELSGLKAKHTKATTAEKQGAVQPAKTVNAKAGGYKPGLDDSLPPDEWVRRRNAELAKAARA